MGQSPSPKVKVTKVGETKIRGVRARKDITLSKYQVTLDGQVVGIVEQKRSESVTRYSGRTYGYSSERTTWSWECEWGGGDYEIETRREAVEGLVASAKDEIERSQVSAPFTARGYFAQREKPGTDIWAVRVERVRTKVIGGVEFVAAAVTTNMGRENEYATDDGFIVTPMNGSYGSGIRWGVQHHGPALEAYWASRGIRESIAGVVNLTDAADMIRRIREHSPVHPRPLT